VSAVVAISAAVIGVVTFDKAIAAPADLPLTLFLVVLGAFGAGFSSKHYERFELHMERARQYRDALDSLLPGSPLNELKRKPTISTIRKIRASTNGAFTIGGWL
jgi:hypothetical protein